MRAFVSSSAPANLPEPAVPSRAPANRTRNAARGRAPASTALAALVLLACFAAGCGALARRNDPAKVGALAVSVDLGIVDAATLERGAGRLWIRLMPAAGEALERELEWTMGPGPQALPGETTRVAADFRRDRTGVEPAVALFDDLAPGRYRISSFLVSARLERKAGEPVLLSLAGDLKNVAPVEIAAGEAADLGRLGLSLLPGGRFDYRLTADEDPQRFTRAVASRADLAAFRPVRRAPPASPARPTAVASAAPRPGNGAAPAASSESAQAGTAEAIGASPAPSTAAGSSPPGAAGGSAPSAARGPGPSTTAGASTAQSSPQRSAAQGSAAAGDAPVPGDSSGESIATGTTSATPAGRSRPALLTGEPRPGGHVTVEPAASSSIVDPAEPVRGAAVAIGLVASIGPALADAREGVGILRLELRRVGRDPQRTIAEIGWELEEVTATAGTGTIDGGARALRLVAPGAPKATRGVALPLVVSPGEHELVALEMTGKLRGPGGERAISASGDLGAYGPVRVGAGELVDVGTLALELRGADRVAVRCDASGGAERAEGILAATDPAGPARRGLVPVARPLSREPAR